MSEQAILDRLSLIEDAIKSTSEDRPLSAPEAASFLNVSLSHLYKLTHRRLIPHNKPMGKLLYFKKRDLLHFIASKPVKTLQQIDQTAVEYLGSRGGVR